MKIMDNLKKSKKTYLLLILTALLSVLLLSACTEVRLEGKGDKDYVLKIEDSGCTKAEAMYLLMEEKAIYEEGGSPEGFWDRNIGDETMSSYARDVVIDRLTRYTAAALMSDQLAAYPTDEEKNRAGEEAVASWTKISGLYNVDAFEITASDVNNLYYKKAVYDAVYKKITDEAAASVTTDSTRVMLADYVVIPPEIGEATATTILNTVRSGVEFSEAAAETGYQVLKSQVIKRGELNTVVDTIAFALVDGEMSEVIESKDGYYIIHCLDDNLIAESAANYNAILATTKEEAFNQAYYEFSKGAKMWTDSRFLENMDISSIQ